MRRGPLETALARLDARLETGAAAPLAVAFSGGGDSTALLLIAQIWAAAHGRALLALTVDHRLQPASAGWARDCAAFCARLGVPHGALVWEGPKPAAGLPAAARAARHRLLAEAARRAGAAVILMGHTADDLREAAAMRAEGSTVSDAREWSPSPAWPEGRGVFLLRPLLGVSRSDLRAFLAERGERWIEDPANEDIRYARTRARRSPPPAGAAPSPGRATHALRFQAGPGESLAAPRQGPFDPAELATAVVCASGGARLPRRDAVERLAARLAAPERFTTTLAGARIEADGARVLVVREAGEHRRRALAPQALPRGEPLVWDGRYEITAQVAGRMVAPLAGVARRLSAAERAALAKIPAPVRPTLPALLDGERVSCPILADDADVSVSGLVFERFRGAAGAIPDEASIRRVAEAAASP